MTFTIRTLEPADRHQWDALWRGYLDFYKTTIPDSVTDLTWQRLLDPEAPILGFCAARDDGKILGIVHYLFHPVTWAAGPRCYLEDLFTLPEARGKGVGRALIQAVYDAADKRGADQVYWLTLEFNATARALYDRVAKATPFIKYRR
ncbi:MAG: GNAT family N-acetyltransferase [Hyphomonadaceae bacterium]|nr:GNAT family N-acetyltransferase [Hyphomonadaceae bacterium]